jgi:hypothetical protein
MTVYEVAGKKEGSDYDNGSCYSYSTETRYEAHELGIA